MQLSLDELIKVFASGHSTIPLSRARPFAEAFHIFADDFEVNTKLRIGHFVTQEILESAYLRTTIEYASGWDYDISVNPGKARKLGNTKRGDGPKYKGHGGIQTTGKGNHKMVGEELKEMYPEGVVWKGKVLQVPDFVLSPMELTKEPWATLGSLAWWKRNGGNAEADRGDTVRVVERISRGVNRGDYNSTKKANGEEERIEIYKLVMKKLHTLSIQ